MNNNEHEDQGAVNEDRTSVNQSDTTSDSSSSVNVQNNQTNDGAGGAGGGDGGANLSGGYNFNFGALSVQADPGLSQVSGSLNLMGIVTPLGGVLQAKKTLFGGSITYSGGLPLQANLPGVNIQGLALNKVQVNLPGGLAALDVSAGSISIGNNLLNLQGIQAKLTGENPNFMVTATSGSLNLFGQNVQLTAPVVEIGRDGQLKSISVGGVQVGAIQAQQVKWDGTNISVLSAGVQLPEIFGQKISAQFQNITVNPLDGTYSGQGLFENDTILSFMNNTLHLSGMKGTVDFNNDQWNVDVLGDLDYAASNVAFGGQGHLNFMSGQTPTFKLENGKLEANLSGVNFTSEGVEYDSSAQVLKILSGEASVPAFGTTLQATIGNASLSSGGFDFESMSFSMSEGVELFPGLSVQVPLAQLKKEGSNYKFTLENGQLLFVQTGVAGTGTVNLEYSNTTGIQGTVSQFGVDTNFMSLTSAGELSFNSDGISLSTATFQLKNLGPESQNLEVTATNAVYGKSGLSIGELDASLPKLGELQLKAKFQNIQIGGGFSGSGQLYNEGDMNFGNGALKISNLAGTVGVSEGGWNISVGADLATDVPNVTASGKVNISHDPATGLALTIPTGELSMNIAGISITSTGITYDSTQFALGITETQVNLPEFEGSELNASLTGVSFTKEGFNFQNLTISSSGAMELMPGLTVSNLVGQLQKEEDKYAVILDGSVALSGALQGGAEKVHLEYRESGSSVVVRNFKAETAIFSVSAGEVAYQNDALSIDSTAIQVKNLGPGSESLSVLATGIVYNSEGLNVQTMDVTLPKIGDVDVKAHLQGLKATGEGLTLQSGQIQTAGTLTMLQGALRVDNLAGTVNIGTEGWGIQAGGDLAVTLPNIQASGRVDIAYSKSEGPKLQVQNGQLDTDFAGLKIHATGLEYLSEGGGELKLGQTTVELPQFANSQLTATVTNASFGAQGFNFENITVQSAGEMQLLPGLYVSGLVGQVQKEGEAYAVILDGTVQFKNSPLQGGAEKVHLEYRNGASSFEIINLHAGTELFEVDVNRAAYSNGELAMDTAVFKAKGLGPGSESLSVTTRGVRYTSEGLFVEGIDVALPKVGDVNILANVTGLSVTSAGVSIQSGSIQANGNISFGNGALTVSDLQGSVAVANNQWAISISGGLATSLENVQAEGQLTISYDSKEGPKLDIQGAKVIGTYAGVVLTAEGMSYNTQDFTLSVTTAKVEIPQLRGGGLETTVTGVKFGPQGFEIEGVAIKSTGTIQLFPGITLSGLSGAFARDKNGTYKVEMGGSAAINTPYLKGGADKVKFAYEAEQASFSFEGLHVESDLFDFRVQNASYENNTINIGQADLSLKNVGPLNGVTSRATGIQYNEQGLTLATLNAQFPKVGDTSVFADFQNLNIPASGGVTGSATVGVNPTNISLLGGKLGLNNIGGTASIVDGNWSVAISAGITANLGAGSEAGGQVTLSYDKQKGPNVQIQGGYLKGSMYGVNVSGEGIDFDMQKGLLTLSTATLTFPKVGKQGVSSTVSGLKLSKEGFEFESIKVDINQSYELFGGVNVGLKSGTIKKDKKKGYGLEIGAGITFTNSNLGMKDSKAEGKLGYNFTDGKFTGSLTKLVVNTSVFSFSVPKGASFNSDGLYVQEATVKFSENFDPEKLKSIIPGAKYLPATVLRALKSLALTGKGITITKNGLQMEDWDLSILEVPIEVPSLGLTGKINPADGTGNLHAQKDFDLKNMKFPTSIGFTIPIVGPIVAEARIGIQGNASLSGDVAVSKRGENFVLSGGLGFNGYLGVFAEILAGVDIGIASAKIGAGAKFGLNFNGYAGLESEVAYNPDAPSIFDKLQAVSPMKFGYFLDANLISSIYLVLETEVLWGLWGSRDTWDLATWVLGTLSVSGAGQGNSFGDLFSNMQSSVVFGDKKGGMHQLAGNRDTIPLPETVRNKRDQSGREKWANAKSIAASETPDE